MAHGDAVIHRDGVEFLGNAAGRLDLAGDHLAKVFQMHMAGHELGEAVNHGDDRLAEITILHAGGPPQAARARHVAAMGGVDAICFTAGIGENSDLIREKVCHGLEFMGIELDVERNRVRELGNREISKKDSRTKIYIIPTNEELVIAKDTYNLVKSK